MAKLVEQWAATDGSLHATQEQADGHDNDMRLARALESFVTSLYQAVPEADNFIRRKERNDLVLGLFKNRKPLMDALTQHNAGPTLRPVGAPTPVAAPSAPVSLPPGAAEATPAPLADPKSQPLGVPPKPSSDATPSAAGPGAGQALPDAFKFTGSKP